MLAGLSMQQCRMCKRRIPEFLSLHVREYLEVLLTSIYLPAVASNAAIRGLRYRDALLARSSFRIFLDG